MNPEEEENYDDLANLDSLPLTLEDLIDLVDMMVEEEVPLDTPVCIDIFMKNADAYLKENIQIEAQAVGWSLETISLGSVEI